MRKFKKLFLLLPVSFLSAVGLTGCDSNEDDRVLRVLNCEDYIYEVNEEDVDYQIEQGDMSDEEYLKYKYNFRYDMTEQFERYWADTHDQEVIKVVYDTFDTNETMFNELQTGKTTYDVIVPSDYMIQKLISNDMLHKISDKNKDGVWENIAPYLVDKFNNIEAVNKATNVTHRLSEFSVPYMWGTVGMMYNPAYYAEEEHGGLSEDEVHELFMDWDSLYTNENIRGTYSIKDSVRDTYAVSLVHAYRDEISQVSDPAKLEEIFNRNSVEEMAFVKDDMLDLKDAAFGFECDSGKTDMVDGKVGANMCWSGDATWAITEAGTGADPKDLYYAIPTYYDGNKNQGASNIWFDGLCMPKNTDHEDNLTEEEAAQYDLAEEFIKFMSTPEVAVQNCYCVGYTPGVGGDAMFEYMLDCYDLGEEDYSELVEGEDYVKYELTYFFGDSVSDEYKDEEGRVFIYADPATAKKELAAQYPEQDILDRLAVMKDFGDEANPRLLDMWEQVRTNALPLWAIIVFAVEGVAAIAFVVYLMTRKVHRKKDKKARS